MNLFKIIFLIVTSIVSLLMFINLRNKGITDLIFLFIFSIIIGCIITEIIKKVINYV